MKLKKKQKREIRRFGEYMISGGAQFWSGYLAYALFDAVFGISFWWAKSISYFLGVTVNYLLERFWVFKVNNVSKKQIKTTAGKFYSLMFVNFILDLGIVGGLREIGITPYIGQFISSAFFTVWNWLLFTLWVFTKKKQPRPKKRNIKKSRA